MTIDPDHARPPGRQKRPLPLRALLKFWRLLVDRPYRHVYWMSIRRPKSAFQPFNSTSFNRYPTIFGFVRSKLGPQTKARILSFGCSTGDEVFSLRHYFPHALIKGMDINPSNIEACRQRLKHTPDDAIAFEKAKSTAAEASGSYDAIFCMAVLRHGGLGSPGVTRCDHLIRFEDFSAMVDDFHRCLKLGGLLVIRHSNFRLCDAKVGVCFETLLAVPVPEKANVPIFGPDNVLMPGVRYPDTVFRKMA
jgi:SAM-dependent methyltransferase